MAIRLSASTIFRPGITAQDRATLNPQYRWAAYVGVLACIPCVVMHTQEITVPGSLWTPWDSSRTLFDVAQERGVYKVAWLQQSEAVGKPPANLAIAALSGFMYPGMLAGLERGVVRDLCAAINPGLQRPPVESPLGSVIRRAQELILAAETQRRAKEVSAGSTGVLDIAAVLATAGEQTVPVEQPAPMVQLPTAAQPVPPTMATAKPAAQGAGVQLALDVQANKGGEGGRPSTIPGNILAWVRAIVEHEPLKTHVEILTGGDVKITKQALGFGQTAGKNYAVLFEAGLVVSKQADSVVCNRRLAEAFEQARAKAKAKE